MQRQLQHAEGGTFLTDHRFNLTITHRPLARPALVVSADIIGHVEQGGIDIQLRVETVLGQFGNQGFASKGLQVRQVLPELGFQCKNADQIAA